MGSDPTTAPVYYYVYTGHGDTIALTDATGAVVASYSYDAWGVLTSDTEGFANGWHNPYLYDGKDGARYDQETGLYWLAVRAYDPTLGRFLARDPLGRAPLLGWADQPYVYAGNNPLVNVDPSGQRFATEGAAQTRTAVGYQRRVVARVQVRRGTAPKPVRACRRPGSHPTCDQIDAAKSAAYTAAAAFGIVGGLIGVIDTTLGKLKDFLLGQISRLFGWNNARTLATIAAAAGVLGTIFAEVMIVGALFFAQAILSDDSYWENPGNLNAFEATLEFGTILGNIVLGLAAFVSAMAVIVEEPPAGAFLAGVTAGAILSLLSLPILIGEAVQNERSKLGY